MGFFWYMGRPFLFMVAPEKAHRFAIHALRSRMAGNGQICDRVLQRSVAGLDFANPLGLSAGFDKNAEIPDAVLKLGFGFMEVGTVTPMPQAGNVRPRLFRLVQHGAIINRMGFNNEGHEVAHRRLIRRKKQTRLVGVNIGANKDSKDWVADYVEGINCFYDVADYFTINISSPNTPGLRDLQIRHNLCMLLDAVLAARRWQAEKMRRSCPVFLKIAPDLTEEELDDIAAEVLSSKLDGLIVSNTTISRTGLQEHERAEESGGMSGIPFFQRSTIVLAKMRMRVGPHLPIIGVGGVYDAETALEKIRAGADLVQLYSSLIYRGPGIAADILWKLITVCRKDGVRNIAEYCNQHTRKWANRKIKL
ncbi:MAG: dihydroorotate dehydrogenase [Candidatus Tokpelaia sp. JSC189]|nr:MAG: dihydroorotate dehydrogenase [Candidatus Tokpelaia sp. JSC189]